MISHMTENNICNNVNRIVLMSELDPIPCLLPVSICSAATAAPYPQRKLVLDRYRNKFCPALIAFGNEVKMLPFLSNEILLNY